MPRFEVNGYSTKKWLCVVEAKDRDEAWDVAMETWNDSNVWDTDTDIVDIELLKDKT